MYKKSTKFSRFINHFITKIKTMIYEQEYHKYGTRIKYMFFEKITNNSLVVVFPACSLNSAKYNYVRTLQSVKCDKLFLLDDFTSNHQGCYFISPKEERCAIDLINHFIGHAEKKYKNIFFVGSSKGAYMALNMSFEIPNTTLIIGSPKYFLGTNLNKAGTIINLKYLIGDPITIDGIKKLDCRLQNKVLHSRIRPNCIYFHYSNVEHTYAEHVRFLLEDLKSVNIPLIEDVKDYPQHGGLKDYYPPFLLYTINKILDQK